MNQCNDLSASKQDINFEDDEIFEDSAFLANLENTSFKKNNVPTDNLNNSVNTSALNVSALCCDEEISGYDKLSGKTWIYPTNYPVRDYQFNIIKAALLKNTLVSLPTGLGKTFIAAVIMYNFYRWYPLGKIVFTAPTRPLVAQQISACYNIIAIPPNDTIEMTGHMLVNTRKTHWQNKRVFFATPQVIYNDLKSGICPGDKIRCLVIDEAHKARGNYAYCQIVATLDDMGCKTYRMLALSATPGSKVDDVINVVRSLHIAHLELRTENCMDVAPYSHSRKINTEIIKLGPHLTQLRQQYVEILDFYARRLKQFNILPQNLGNLSRGRIVMLYKEYQAKDRGSRHPQHNYIMKDFTLLIALYHGLELLVKHGSRVFLNFFDEHPEKTWIQSDDKLTAMLERLRDDLGVNPLSLDRSILPDGSIPEIPKDLCFGHPKFDRLKAIILDHFTRAKQREQDTRAIIFCEYRESVNLVHCLLLQCRPLVLPQMFVGQGAAGKDGKTLVSQKQQMRVMRNFREGLCNTLVATCVAEEGLDVGSVDLIVCFDISNSSPVRLVQRCGRTGRERAGLVYVLVTEGREHQTLMECMRQRDGLNRKILQSKEVQNNLYASNPRMMPRDCTPECLKMYITVADRGDKEKEKEKGGKKGQKSIRSMLLNNKSSITNNLVNKQDVYINREQFNDLFPDGFQCRQTFRRPENYWAMDKETLKERAFNTEDAGIKLSKWLEWQRTAHKTINVEHSRDSDFLVNVLQKCDERRLQPTQDFGATNSSQELLQRPISPLPMILSQTKSPSKTPTKAAKGKKKKVIAKSPAKNYGDIRALFCTTTKSTKYTKLISDLGVQNDGSVPTRLINLLVDLNLNADESKCCLICRNICDCINLRNASKSDENPNFIKFLTDPTLPDLNLIGDVDVDLIKQLKNTSLNKSSDEVKSLNDARSADCKENDSNFDLDFDFNELDEFDSPEIKVEENSALDQSADKNFDLGGIDDILVVSSPEEVSAPVVANKSKTPEKKALHYFGLDSLDDIFADYEDDFALETESKQVVQNETNNNIKPFKDEAPNVDYPLSPSILSGKQRVNPTSPILCSQRKSLSIKKKPETSTPSHARNLTANTKASNTTTDASMFSVTQLVEMINKTDDKLDQSKVDERSGSPILLTQSERKAKEKRAMKNTKSESLIILSSDDSNDTVEYELDKKDVLQRGVKRKSEVTASPHFSKKPKIGVETQVKPLTVQEKILAAITSNKSQTFANNQTNFHFSVTRPSFSSQKENVIPQLEEKEKRKKKDLLDSPEEKWIKPDMLQKYRYQTQSRKNPFGSPQNVLEKTQKNILEDFICGENLSPKKDSPVKRNVYFGDSDDDFVDNNGLDSPRPANKPKTRMANHKVRKKRKANSLLHLEASLSDGDNDSGDELTDDSLGSVADFICDDDDQTRAKDIQAIYLKSVRSPVKKNGFKIPELPKKFNKQEIFSQFVEEDAYEMDSFCVDSHIGLTQLNEVSELELAEKILEEKRKSKRQKRKPFHEESGDSPLIRKIKRSHRRINSDSDDSS